MSTDKKIILGLLSLAMFLVVLDSAIVNVALPAIKEALHFEPSLLQWVLTAYILTFGGFLMFGGRAADLYGRRRVLVMGIGGFVLFSLLTGLSNSSTMLIVTRALQGLAGAFMSPTALSILLTTFESENERNRALSVWSMVASGSAAVGVFLGGLLTQYLNWRWNFFVNVPVGIAAIVGILKYMPAHIHEAKDKHLDLPGAALITTGLMALVYALTLATEHGWAALSTLSALGTSVVLIAAFIFNESKAKHPLMPLSIFRIRNVVGGNLVALPIVAGALGMFFFCSQFVQNILQFSPLKSGLCFLPIPLIIGVISYYAPQLLSRFGFRPLLITGTSLMAVAITYLSFINAGSSYVVGLLPGFILLALGMGISFVSATVAATAGVPGEEAGLAAGLVNTSQQVGGALGLSILAVVANATTTRALARGVATGDAIVSGYQNAFLCSAALIVIALLMAIFVIRKPKIGSEVTPPIAL